MGAGGAGGGKEEGEGEGEGEENAEVRAVRGAVSRALSQALPLCPEDTREYALESLVAELDALEPPLELLFEAGPVDAGRDNDSEGEEGGDGGPAGAFYRAFGEMLVDLAAAEDEAEAQDFCECLARHVGKVLAVLAAEAGDTNGAGLCELCDRSTPLTRHHLVPRTLHKEFRRLGWSRKNLEFGVAMLCRPCHSAVHLHATERELAEVYNTVEKLLEHEQIRAFACWASQQKAPPTTQGHDNRLQSKR